MFYSDEELQKWKVDDLKKYLQQRGVPIGNNIRKAVLVEKVIFAQKLELQILPSQGEREKEIALSKAQKLNIDGVQIPHPNEIQNNWMTGSEYLPSVLASNVENYAQLNTALKASREGRNLLFSNHVRSVEFNNITSSLKYCFVKGIVIPQTRVNESPYNVWVCIHEDGSVLTGECGCVAGLISSCKHVFALLHYIENEVVLGHNKTCTSKKQKWDVRVYKKNEKVHPPSKMENVLFSKPHPEYEYNEPRCLSKKRSHFEPRSPHHMDVSFSQSDWEELAKAPSGTASVLQFIQTSFLNLFLLLHQFHHQPFGKLCPV